MLIKEGMIVKIWVNGGKDILKFQGEVLGVDDSFIEINDKVSHKRKILGKNSITNIELINEENEENEENKI